MYSAHPIVRLVLPAKKIPYQKARQIQAMSLAFDDEYRRPDQPRRRVPVKCDEAQLIGVFFILERRVKAPMRIAQSTNYRSIWMHDSLTSGSRSLNHTHPVSFRQGTRYNISAEYLVLDPEFKKDGVWTLEVFRGSQILFEDSFELMGCPDEKEAD